ncbi:MAG: hypothetical protein O2826_06565 [Chloroflexi bacterium]|nr:hypothetical protein [Chloroflexota bacterium]
MMPNDQDRIPSESPLAQTRTFAFIRSEFERTSESIAAFGDARPSSAAAYDSLGYMIMRSYLDSVEQIDATGLPYHHNLGVALFCELHTQACYHYYREYDRIQGLTETASPHEIRRSKRSFGDLLSAARRRLPKVNLAVRKSEWDVAFAGTTTFTWPALRGALAPDGVSLRNGSTGKPSAFPRADVQAAMLRAWVYAIHDQIATMLGVSSASIKRYGPDPIRPLLTRMAGTPTLSDAPPDLLITGTLGEFRTRLTALSAMARGIPVLTFHHGAQYGIGDEPYYGMYEGYLPDFKVVYGDTTLQRQAGATTDSSNVRGSETRLFSRTDKTIRRLRSAAPVETLTSLRGKSVLYMASEFETVRYGPFRDIHPSTYLAWQQELLRWLQTQTGAAPAVRLHPKRPSTHFDPQGYPLADGDLIQEIERADVLVVDYPTTSLAIALATTKPVLYFDLGIRRLFPAAVQAIEARCMTAATDPLDPTAGPAAMEASLGKACTDTFTEMFSFAPGSGDEVSDSAKAIAQALAIR